MAGVARQELRRVFAEAQVGMTGANALIFSTFQAQFLRPAPAVSNDDSRARIWALERATAVGGDAQNNEQHDAFEQIA